jgi:hypothetical protein
MEWHRLVGGKPEGPFPAEDLRRLASIGQFGPTELVWRQGMPAWVPAGRIADLFPPAVAPPSLPPPSGMSAPTGMRPALAGSAAVDPDATPPHGVPAASLGPPLTPATSPRGGAAASRAIPSQPPRREPPSAVAVRAASSHRFAPLAPLEQPLLRCLYVLVALDGLHLGTAVVVALAGGGGSGSAVFDAQDMMAMALPIAWAVLVIITGVTFVNWLRGVIANAHDLAEPGQVISANASAPATQLLLHALTSLQEAWRASAPPGRRDASTGPIGPWAGVTCAGLLAGVTGRGFGQLLGLFGIHYGIGSAGFYGAIVPHGLSLASWVLAIMIVRQLGARQVALEAAIARARSVPRPAVVAAPRREQVSVAPAAASGGPPPLPAPTAARGAGRTPPPLPASSPSAIASADSGWTGAKPWPDAERHAELARRIEQLAFAGAVVTGLVATLQIVMRGGNPLLLDLPFVPFPRLAEIAIVAGFSWGVWKHRSRACACLLAICMVAVLAVLVTPLIRSLLRVEGRALGRRPLRYLVLGIVFVLRPIWRGIQATFQYHDLEERRPA